MSEIQDSAAIIAADMRHLADDIEAGRAIVGQSVWRSYADRVEAIGTGNIAKLRNALELSKVAILVAKKKMNLENPVILEIIDDALAAPPRNCDMPLVVDGPADNNADKAWLVFKRHNPDAYFDVSGLLRCIDWLLAPATNKEGGAK